MSVVIDIIKDFESIDLKEMESVKLMDRTDTKFTFLYSQLTSILNIIKPHYKVLTINNKRHFSYKTLYYDTHDMMLYNVHHNGRLNRYKIRHRSYLDTNTGFLEVKFKNNKGRTIKERIEDEIAPTNWNVQETAFLTTKLPFDPLSLKPIIWVNYSRMTLVSKKGTERVTLDLNLNFVSGAVKKQFDNLVIAEVKQDKRQNSEFIRALKKFRIKEGALSKYCLGIAVTKDVKSNNFKEKINSINKIINYGNIAASK